MVFQRCELRTTDPARARAFYRTLVGDAPRPIVALPERAQERGAPSHWLGHLAVEDPTAERERWTAAGASPLGPMRSDGVAVLKDPFGSPVALAPVAEAEGGHFVWSELHTADVDAAWAFYGRRRAWERCGRGSLPMPSVRFRDPAGREGGLVETVGRGAHPHWLHYLPVPDLEAALAVARDAGARVSFGPVDGVLGRVAALDDPLGAAFGLLQRF